MADTWTPAANALVDLATVKDELGLSVTTFDNRLIRLINAASEKIEAFCARGFAAKYVTERLAVPYPTPVRLILSRIPVIAAPAPVLTQDAFTTAPAPIAATEYDVENLGAGFLYNVARWPTTGRRRPDIAQDYESGGEEASLWAAYVGGYVTQVQVQKNTGSPPAGCTAPWTTLTAYAIGDLIVPTAGTTNQLWICSVAGSAAAGEPSWGTPAVGSTKTDGTVTWTFLGPRNLPADLEQAAIDCVVAWYRNAGQDLNIQGERLGDASVTYAAGRGSFPAAVKETLMRYRRVL